MEQLGLKLGVELGEALLGGDPHFVTVGTQGDRTEVCAPGQNTFATSQFVLEVPGLEAPGDWQPVTFALHRSFEDSAAAAAAAPVGRAAFALRDLQEDLVKGSTFEETLDFVSATGEVVGSLCVAIRLLSTSAASPGKPAAAVASMFGHAVDARHGLTITTSLVTAAAETVYFLDGTLARLLEARSTDLSEVSDAGESPLHVAARCGHVEALGLLLGHVVADEALGDGYGNNPLVATFDPDQGDALGRSALLTACAAGQGECAELLVRFGCDAEHTDDNGDRALALACGTGCVAAVQVLLDVARADPDGGASASFSDKRLASRKAIGDADRCPLVRASGARADPEGAVACTALLLEALHSRFEGGAFRGGLFRAHYEACHVYAMHAAARDGDAARVRLLDGYDIPLESVADLGRRPLHLATDRPDGDVQVLKALLACGANTEAGDARGGTALHAAARAGRLDCAQILLDHGAGAVAKDATGKQPLHIACTKGHAAIAALILDKGALAKTGAGDLARRTALHDACQDGHPQCIAVLLARGADPNQADLTGTTPMHDAARACSDKAAEAMLAALPRLKLGTVDVAARTSLHRACEAGSAKVVGVLLGAVKGDDDPQAILDARDEDDLSAAYLACCASHVSHRHAILALLEAAGATPPTPKEVGEISVGRSLDAATERTLAEWHGRWLLTRRGLAPAKRKAHAEDEFTNLHDAAAAGNANCVRALLKKGADVTATRAGALRESALHLACANARLECVRLLVKAGAPLEPVLVGAVADLKIHDPVDAKYRDGASSWQRGVVVKRDYDNGKDRGPTHFSVEVESAGVDEWQCVDGEKYKASAPIEYDRGRRWDRVECARIKVLGRRPLLIALGLRDVALRREIVGLLLDAGCEPRTNARDPFGAELQGLVERGRKLDGVGKDTVVLERLAESRWHWREYTRLYPGGKNGPGYPEFHKQCNLTGRVDYAAASLTAEDAAAIAAGKETLEETKMQVRARRPAGSAHSSRGSSRGSRGASRGASPRSPRVLSSTGTLVEKKAGETKLPRLKRGGQKAAAAAAAKRRTEIDTDGDGVLSAAERAAFAQSQFDLADADGDGELTEGELAAADAAGLSVRRPTVLNKKLASPREAKMARPSGEVADHREDIDGDGVLDHVMGVSTSVTNPSDERAGAKGKSRYGRMKARTGTFVDEDGDGVHDNREADTLGSVQRHG